MTAIDAGHTTIMAAMNRSTISVVAVLSRWTAGIRS